MFDLFKILVDNLIFNGFLTKSLFFFNNFNKITRLLSKCSRNLFYNSFFYYIILVYFYILIVFINIYINFLFSFS